MKVLPDPTTSEFEPPPANTFELPGGLIGFANHRRAELLYFPDHLPFLWLRLHGPDMLHFVVIEPGGLIPGYEPEIFDEDAASLDLANPAEAMILNIVTLHRQVPFEASVNLIGPLIVNRRTRQARQVVISNYSRYSAHHRLVERSQPSRDALIA
ncbi:MAG TPA: flagellar assembly protein FliW [Opitutus sp.]|nr:flagellar assembly protein FliW [Opitutus sp.]